jgi:hypothetical protein
MSVITLLPSISTFEEQYAWVDELLNNKYNNYALTSNNIDDFMEAGLLGERWAWVDQRLTELYSTFQTDEIQESNLLTRKWSTQQFEIIKTEQNDLSGIKRKRSESDISDYDEEISSVIKRLSIEEIEPVTRGRFIDLDTMVTSQLDINIDINILSLSESDSDEDYQNNWIDRDGANSEEAFGLV